MSNDKLRRLQRGEEVNLHEIDPGLHRVHICLGWTAPEQSEGFPVDLDASAFMLGMGDRVRQDTDFVFYNNLETEGGIVKHLGDNVTGADGPNKGDCEIMEVDLDNIPFDVEKVSFTVTIHNSEERQQTFGLVKDAYMRIVNADTKAELVRFDLGQSAAEEDGFIFGELYRLGVSWQFKPVGQGITGGLFKVARGFDVNVAPN